MWCWHRIRETESGLCPACRTPYGEDPHQFSAVDVDKAIKANKEKEAAAKRDRQRSTQPNPQPPGQLQQDNGDVSVGVDGFSMEVPKDRMQLANMRVIRRNLVYAVGLPPSVGTEDTLRKPEYFGQYGKIAKIVVNRTQATTSDPRRASASAYVTFVHKEDTLACILALDGFNMEGRNVRASFGTSKYCSAFIKNMRCNNPECTYLHEMGATEDTFSKQEIQAGYVTSGRDVLARQQQIVEEQLKLAGAGSAPRKRVGAGGPSGTGKASQNPVFPAPEFDEPSKPSPNLVPLPTGVARASTTGTGTSVPPKTSSRTTSGGVKSPTTGPTTAAVATVASVAPVSLPPQRKPVSAASVVAGVHAVNPPRAEPQPHTTLTSLTPLKRTSKASRTSSSSSSTNGDVEKLSPPRMASATATAKKKNGLTTIQPPTATQPTDEQLEPPAIATNGSKQASLSIGGDPIGPPAPVRNAAPVSSLGGDLLGSDHIRSNGSSNTSFLGGSLFTGELHPQPNAAIGRKDKWNADSSTERESDALAPAASLWGGNGAMTDGYNLPPGSASGGVIGDSRHPRPGTIGNSTSALASLLGIRLPTGSGSLQESNWETPCAPTSPSPLSSLNNGSFPVQGSAIGGVPFGGVTPGGTQLNSGSSLIGGIPLGGSAGSTYDNSTPGTIGSATNNHSTSNNYGNTKSDIALLQSLLPGVHITSGSDNAGFGSMGGWNEHSGPSSLNGDALWGSGPADHGPAAIGTIGGGVAQQNQRGAGIW